MFKPNLIGSGFRIQVIVSGKKTDKSGVFETFYGELKYAPMIKECPITMECKLYDTYDTPTHDLFIGEVVAVQVSEEVLDERGRVDNEKLMPILFTGDAYWGLGSLLGRWGSRRR